MYFISSGIYWAQHRFKGWDGLSSYTSKKEYVTIFKTNAGQKEVKFEQTRPNSPAPQFIINITMSFFFLLGMYLLRLLEYTSGKT